MTESYIPEYTTITDASKALGMTRTTVRKRIQFLVPSFNEGSSIFYPTIDVMRNCLLKATDAETSDLNLTQEKARYYRELTEKVKVEKERMAERLLDRVELEIQQTKVRLAFKEKLLNLSSKLGPRLSRMKDTEKIIDLLETSHREILEELGGSDEYAFGEDSGEDEAESQEA